MRQLIDLLQLLSLYLDSKIEYSIIEELTMKIVAADMSGYPDYIQDMIYALNMNDLNNLSRTDIENIRSALEAYLDNINS